MICNKGFADSRDLRKHVNVHNKASDRYKFQGRVKPLSVQNNQQNPNYDHDNVLFKYEPIIKLEEIASVIHPMNDMLDIDQIKIEVEDSDEIMDDI